MFLDPRDSQVSFWNVAEQWLLIVALATRRGIGPSLQLQYKPELADSKSSI